MPTLETLYYFFFIENPTVKTRISHEASVLRKIIFDRLPTGS